MVTAIVFGSPEPTNGSTVKPDLNLKSGFQTGFELKTLMCMLVEISGHRSSGFEHTHRNELRAKFTIINTIRKMRLKN
jgi:hypothetical protein